MSEGSNKQIRTELDSGQSKDITDTTPIGWNFDNSYSRLPKSFYARTNPVPVRSPRIVVFNEPLAESLGLNIQACVDASGTAVFAGNTIPERSEPITQTYAGHQFGHFTMLGDGRAILLGEQVTPNGERFDIQLKGSGPTPFSRRGDGRASLGPMLREYIISEAMHSLGIPTTRSLAVVMTGEPILRETILPGAVLTRIATSHIRVGTFECIAKRDDREEIQILADYTLSRHFSSIIPSDNPYLALLQGVIERQASLVAQWQLVGFIHGVMNTDNMAISGETIDYGPCAFMDVYNPTTVFSSIDRQGRYKYCNQPMIAQWNLARFAETLLPLLCSNQERARVMATEAIETFPAIFERYWLAGMRAKLGFFTEETKDIDLIETLLEWMQKHQMDYTHTIRALTLEKLPDEHLFQGAAFTEWHSDWQTRLKNQSESEETSRCLMRSHNPAIIPRNHHVEEALKAGVEHSNFTVMQRLLTALKNPYDDSPSHTDYRTPPVPSEHAYQTFCGT